MSTPDVRPGQIWANNDKRSAGRKVRIVAIDEQPDPRKPGSTGYAVVEQVTGRRTRIRLDRFRPTTTGYRLIQDTEATR